MHVCSKISRKEREVVHNSRDPAEDEVSLGADFNEIMLWAACCLCFFGFLRAGEITVPSERAYDKGEHLNVSDILVDSVTNPTTMKVKNPRQIPFGWESTCSLAKQETSYVQWPLCWHT